MGTRREHGAARRSRRGGALIAALLVVMLVAGLSAAMLRMSSASSRRHLASLDQKKALYLAEAGLSEACLGLVLGKTGNVGTSQLPAEFGEGVFWVEASDAGGGVTQLKSTALCGGGRAALAIYVTNEATSIGALGFFGAEGLSVGDGAHVDGYDSGEAGEGEGLLDPLLEGPPPAAPAELGSNANVVLTGGASGTTIEGDAEPGPAGSVLLGAGATVTGSTLPRAEAAELPEVEVPDLASTGDLTVTGLLPMTITGEKNYGSLVVRGQTLTISGPATIVANSIAVKTSGRLKLDTSGGAIAIFVTGSMKVDSTSSLLNVGADATQCTLSVAATDTVDLNGDGSPDPAMSLGGRGTFYGLIYSPQAALTIPASLPVYGAVVARTLTLANNAALHYDAALADPPAGTMVPTLLCWRLLELPENMNAIWTSDPKTALGLSKDVVLPKPADAHEEALWGIKFIDTLGVTRTWVGVRSAFDWSRVQTVIWQGNSSDEAGWLANIGSLVGRVLGR